ncbi:ComF family protein [Paenibacillus sp. NFR01]|uniref:ComF family protein n=1 Tax=Paenibacillus sp. NFR01 TaxID=1566279 RepID=UPI0008C32632|nr:ComF family protein [Paenibacillus sp. NFR01]SEU14085.1 Predicted amidophosphoribosyltransferases [Paenibacillus sp. NFR01]
MKLFANWRQSLNSLLGPDLQWCRLCGRKGVRSKEAEGLCLKCAASIPWIRTPRCLKCGRPVGCPDCNRSFADPGLLILNRSAVTYSEVMRELLGRYKYRGDEHLIGLFGMMMDRAYSMMCLEMAHLHSFNNQSSASTFPIKISSPNITTLHQKHAEIIPSRLHPRHAPAWQGDLLVPVPVSESRLRERGFNQAEQLADQLSIRYGIPQLPLLVRTHHTAKQSFKSRAERLNDMKHAFAFTSDLKVAAEFAFLVQKQETPTPPLRIIIIDDIYTTGSTLRACAAAIDSWSRGIGYPVSIYSLTLARS